MYSFSSLLSKNKIKKLMQPIIVIAIVGVAAIALGTGFLNNDIELWIQDFGVGAGDIELPADHAIIDFNIAQFQDETSGFYKNRINKCIVTLNADVGTTTNQQKQSEITCKITGKEKNAAGQWVPNHKVLSEGKICALKFTAGVPYMVPLGSIDGCTNTSPLLPGTPTTLDPKMAGDVILVVHANTYNNGMTIP